MSSTPARPELEGEAKMQIIALIFIGFGCFALGFFACAILTQSKINDLISTRIDEQDKYERIIKSIREWAKLRYHYQLQDFIEKVEKHIKEGKI